MLKTTTHCSLPADMTRDNPVAIDINRETLKTSSQQTD